VWKWIVIVIVVVVLVGVAAGVGFALQSSGVMDQLKQQMDPKRKPLPVRFGVAERGTVVRAINAPGQIEPRSKVEISAQVSARIIELPFDANDAVKKDDVVVRLDSRDLEALLDQARAQLRSEEAALDGARASKSNAEAELARAIKLAQSGDISATERDAAQLAYERAASALRQVEHAIESARAAIVRAEKDRDNTIILAPFDGVITKRNAEVGETVVVGTINSPGSVILEIADLATMLMKARVDEAHVAKVREGQEATVYINAFADRKFAGRVTRVGLKRQTDSNGTEYFETEVDVDQPPDVMLRSGLTANVDIAVESFAGVVRVPSQAVLDRAVDDLPSEATSGSPHVDREKKFARVVYVEKDAKAWPVAVSVGASDQTHSAITGGLEAGTRVVVGPFKALTGLQHGQLLIDEAVQQQRERDRKNGEEGTVEAKDGARGEDPAQASAKPK
jgi:HlyD family secretion protein